MIDLQLIEECRNGNFNNFRKLVELSSPFIYSVAFRMLGDEAHAKDIVQETMITIWQKIKKIKTAEGYKVWMYRIVVNKCYDEMRKKKRAPEFSADDKTWEMLNNKISEGPSAALENAETTKVIEILTNKLSAKQKTVFVLSDLEGMSHDEISDITGIGKSAVKANLYHARKAISEKIEKYL